MHFTKMYRYRSAHSPLRHQHRGGRDGMPCESVLYASDRDLRECARLEKGSRRGAMAELAGLVQVRRGEGNVLEGGLGSETVCLEERRWDKSTSFVDCRYCSPRIICANMYQ